MKKPIAVKPKARIRDSMILFFMKRFFKFEKDFNHCKYN